MIDNNRIGASCWFCRYDYTNKKVEDWKPGYLRAWAMDYEESNGNYGPFPVGVVESEETGLCHSVSVERICFAAVPPGRPTGF